MTATEDQLNSLVHVLHESGYKAVPKFEFSCVSTGVSGYIVSVYFDGINQIQLNAIFRENTLGLNFLNKFNSRHRFVKIFEDGDGDLTAVSDHFLDIFAVDGPNQLERALNSFSQSLVRLADSVSTSAVEG